MMKKIEKYTIGMGDRFGHQGEAQLSAVIDARKRGIDVYPVWNKSHREHEIIGTQPESLAQEVREAVGALGWSEAYHIDADHIRRDTVDGYLPHSDFFTLDVSEKVGVQPEPNDVDAWINFIKPHFGDIYLEGMNEPLTLGTEGAQSAANRFLQAVVRAGELYRYIASQKDHGTFITELSIDETAEAQSPEEMLYILSMLAWQQVPVQTIAPKFTGRFNKGVDYVGDTDAFARDFEADLGAIDYAVKTFGLPDTLKISVHTGSDKFSLYPIINELSKKHDAGIHLKTAGTTWLEEVIGLARAGGDALELAKEIVAESLNHVDDLVSRYQHVIQIDPEKLPSHETVNGWDSDAFSAALTHDPNNPQYNPHFRQLLHVGFKTAAQRGDEYHRQLEQHAEIIGAGVRDNLLNRHICPLFA